MDKRSTEGVAEEWRKHGFSGQVPCRTSTGAAFRAGAFFFTLFWHKKVGRSGAVLWA